MLALVVELGLVGHPTPSPRGVRQWKVLSKKVCTGLGFFVGILRKSRGRAGVVLLELGKFSALVCAFCDGYVSAL